MTLRDVAGTHGPDDPTDLSRADYRAAFKRAMGEVKDDDVPGLAAGVAFKIFLSIFPSLIAAVAIFSLVTEPAEIGRWIGETRGMLPESAIDLLQDQLRRLTETKSSATALTAVLGIGVGLWAATGAAVSLMKALSRSYDVPETRKFVKQRLVGLMITVALITALLGVVLLLVVGRQIQEALLPGLAPPLSWLLVGLRFVLAIALLLLLFAFVYWIGPNRDHPSWVWMSPGALLAVIGWLLASGGFTIYAQRIGQYEATYGAIGGVLVLLLWLQISMLVTLVGAELNAEVERTRALHVRVGEGAGFAVPGTTAALLAPHPDASAETIKQTEIGAHTVTPTDESPPPTVPEKDSLSTTPGSSSKPRKAGAIAAGLMAVAVFLGLARKRAHR